MSSDLTEFFDNDYLGILIKSEINLKVTYKNNDQFGGLLVFPF